MGRRTPWIQFLKRYRTPTLSTVLRLELEEFPICLFCVGLGWGVSLSESPHWMSLNYYHSGRSHTCTTASQGPARLRDQKKRKILWLSHKDRRAVPSLPTLGLQSSWPQRPLQKVPCIYQALNLEAQRMKHRQRRGPHRRWGLRGKLGRGRGGGWLAERTENWWDSWLKGPSTHPTALLR